MSNSWTSYVVLSALTLSVVGIFIWSRRRKNYVKVGKISKLFFYPVKSLKAVEVTKGKCTKLGFEVNGILDRTFMVVNEEGFLVSQREAPSLVLLTPHISDNYIIINGPNTDTLKVEIKASPSPSDKSITCTIHGELINGVDCGDEAASWFESYLNKRGVRFVRFFSTQNVRKYLKKNIFYRKLREKFPAGFQDLTAFHVVSQASIDDLNSKIEDEKKTSVYNFRPNILVEGCKPFAEDSWKYMKFDRGAELTNVLLTTRCILTTNDPDKGILSQKEPLVTLRKYRITDDLTLSKILGSVPCLGTSCAVNSTGEIAVGDEIFAVVGKSPKMKDKLH